MGCLQQLSLWILPQRTQQFLPASAAAVQAGEQQARPDQQGW
jgi:hypothetical protein